MSMGFADFTGYIILQNQGTRPISYSLLHHSKEKYKKKEKKKRKKGFVTQGTDTALAHFQITPNFPAVKFSPLPKFRGRRRSTFYFLNLDHSGRQWKQNVLYMYTSEQFFLFCFVFCTIFDNDTINVKYEFY